MILSFLCCKGLSTWTTHVDLARRGRPSVDSVLKPYVRKQRTGTPNFSLAARGLFFLSYFLLAKRTPEARQLSHKEGNTIDVVVVSVPGRAL